MKRIILSNRSTPLGVKIELVLAFIISSIVIEVVPVKALGIILVFMIMMSVVLVSETGQELNGYFYIMRCFYIKRRWISQKSRLRLWFEKSGKDKCSLDALNSDFESMLKSSAFKPHLEYAAVTHSKYVRTIEQQPNIEIVKKKELPKHNMVRERKVLKSCYCKTNECGISPCWKNSDALKLRKKYYVVFQFKITEPMQDVSNN